MKELQDIQDIIIQKTNNIIVGAVGVFPNLIAAILIFFLIIFLGKVVNKIVERFLKKSDILESHFDIYLKISKVFFFFIATILFLNTVGLKSIAAGLFAGGSLLTLISGFAFKEIGENIFAGILLSFQRPFSNGDVIKSGEFEGSVKEIKIRSTHIRSADGKDIFIPSTQIYKNTLINYTRDGFRRFSLNIGISYDDDIDLACDIISKEMGKIHGILDNPEPNVFVHQTFANYIELTANFWVDVHSKNGDSDKIITQLLSKVKGKLVKSGLTLSSHVSSNVNFKIIPELPTLEGMAH